MDDSLYDLWTDFSPVIWPKTKDKRNCLNWLVELNSVCTLFSAGFDVTGLDLSADMLKIAEKRAASPNRKLTLLKATC